jgi:hypothetical protein
MRGTGATPRSGRVRVFALRIVAPEVGGLRVVGVGTSLNPLCVWKRRAIVKTGGKGVRAAQH